MQTALSWFTVWHGVLWYVDNDHRDVVILSECDVGLQVMSVPVYHCALKTMPRKAFLRQIAHSQYVAPGFQHWQGLWKCSVHCMLIVAHWSFLDTHLI